MNITIRESIPDDNERIESIYPLAFPGEDLLQLVGELLRNTPEAMSLVALDDSNVIGHVIFTHCGIEERDEKVALLGPLAVVPQWQRRGFGTELVEHGLKELAKIETNQVFVLGDPNYYQRFGFSTENNVAPPYVLPAEWREAWQAKSIAGNEAQVRGKLSLPKVWMETALWLP